jgi:hypothetical protein
VSNDTPVEDLGDDKEATKKSKLKKSAALAELDLLKELTIALLTAKSKEIAWQYDGSEYELIANDPLYQAAIKETTLESKINSIIKLVNQWAIDTKENNK